jgi:hypothetical protein
VPESTAVQSFLRNPNVRPMSFPMSEAFTRIFPDLARMTLPQARSTWSGLFPPTMCSLLAPRPRF